MEDNNKKKAGFSGNRFLYFIRSCAVRYILMVLAAVFLCAMLPGGKVYAAPVKVVIDPGHGGEENGAEYGIYTEKYITMVVAKAMAEELEKYDGVEVYMTRTEDVKMSLQERADYAKSVGADFLFCIHFNASKSHKMYGSEVWCSAFGNCYAEGRLYGELCLDELSTLGLYRRGVKMKLSEKEEDKDYYGIIRHCLEYDIPSVIIEHCYLDNPEDEKYYHTAEGMKRLGVLDATAAAKYYGLSSKELNVNYKGYPKPDLESLPKMDLTEPENVSLTCLRVKKETGEAEILLTAKDEESGLLYYTCSLDGGNTYGSFQRWESDSDELEFVIQLPRDQDIDLRYMVYNGYDLFTESEIVHIDAMEERKEDSGLSGNDVTEGDFIPPEENPDSIETMAGGSGKGSVIHEIDMSRYADRDADRNAENSLFGDTDFSAFFWLMILGLLLALLVVLLIIRSAAVKKQKKAKYRGRRL